MSSEIRLHPLVILNISDQQTRTRLIDEQSTQIAGALMGIQQGRTIHLKNSFEVPLNADGIDREFLIKKQELYKQVFPELEFMGWYTNVNVQLNSVINKQFSEWNESPVVLILDSTETTKDLPIKVYESNVDISTGALVMNECSYRIETTEAERIGVDHAVHSSDPGDTKNMKLLRHLNTQKSAVEMLRSRIKILIQFVQDIQQGLLPHDHDILLEISSLCARLPAIQGQEFQVDFNRDYNDTLLVSLLSVVTKGTELLQDLNEKTRVLSSRRNQKSRRSEREYK